MLWLGCYDRRYMITAIHIVLSRVRIHNQFVSLCMFSNLSSMFIVLSPYQGSSNCRVLTTICFSRCSSFIKWNSSPSSSIGIYRLHSRSAWVCSLSNAQKYILLSRKSNPQNLQTTQVINRPPCVSTRNVLVPSAFFLSLASGRDTLQYCL